MPKLPSLLVIGSLLSLASAHAQLAHRYDLSTVNDSVGTANGTLVNATLANGMLTTTNTSPTAGGGYLQLPASIGTGITGNFSIEIYATQAGAEDANTSLFSISATTTNFALLKPNSGGTGPRLNFEQPGVAGGAQSNIGPGGTTSVFAPFGGEHQIVVTYTASSGTLSLYNNGALLTSAVYGTGLSFQSLAGGVGGINGGDPFNDLSFNGSTNDFRIYSNALSGAQVTALYNGTGTAGSGVNLTNTQINAIAVPEPSVWMAMLAGVGALLGGRRFRRA